MKDYSDVNAYLAESTLWADEIRAVRPMLVEAGLDEEIKWGKPTYCHGGANVVIVQEFKGHLALLFVKGILLDDPGGLLVEQGPNTHGPRRMEFTSVEQIEAQRHVIRACLVQAIEVEDAGTELPPRPEESLAVELQERLAADEELAAAFDQLTPGRQREYNIHISGAKQSATRKRRVDAAAPRILAGKGLRDR